MPAKKVKSFYKEKGQRAHRSHRSKRGQSRWKSDKIIWIKVNMKNEEELDKDNGVKFSPHSKKHWKGGFKKIS